jgi:signal transduction histidine kinase/CheY-like chemotaxis protein
VVFEYFRRLLDTRMLSPYGFCLLWKPELLWTHVLSDALIGLAYMTIPVTLAVILLRRRDIPFGGVVWAFALFITACGFTHFMSIWTLWNPDYGAEALLKAATAIVSVLTAILLWRLVPLAVGLPSPAHLREVNTRLERMVAERDAAIATLRDEKAQRARAEEALVQAQKIEAVGQLTGGVAHDFNNLLTVIIGGLDTVRRHARKDPARVQRAADMAFLGAQRAAGLTARLLAFARRQPLSPTPLDINATVRGLTDLLHRTLGETIELECVLGAGVWTIEADHNQLESAIVNLAVNARDSMPDGGKLTIETANAELGHAYAELDAEVVPGPYVVISVSDTGSGMSKETLSHAFEPFFTTKEVGKGTGLGLSMVYGFVKQSGGHVTIYSEVAEGTTVNLYFPRHFGDVPHTSPEVRALPQGGSGETILIVEDNDEVRAFSSMTLSDLGYDVITAANAREAMEILTGERRIDLLFTDVVLPGDSGRVLSERAVMIRPGLRVLFTTGYSRNAIVHHGRLDAGVQLITKPFTVDQLAIRVREILDKATGA